MGTGQASIGADLKRVEDEGSGSVHLRFNSVETATGKSVTEVGGRIERGEGDTLMLTILPAAAKVTAEYKAVERLPLRAVKGEKR